MTRLKLDPTAALMIKWGRKAFNKDVIESFIDHLDLTSADELFLECYSVCDWYEEVVLNRKYFVNSFVDEVLRKSSEEYLILILAAGKSPHSLQFLLNNPDKINRILEVDLSGMDEKKELYDTYFSGISNKIKCITADISSMVMFGLLNDLLHEFFKDMPCMTILEGVSYFLTEEELENIISSCHSNTKNNIFVLEYLLPTGFISSQRQHIPNQIYEILNRHSGLKTITPFTFESISQIFSRYGGSLLKRETLTDIERQRIGENKYFTSPNDGWIECSAWKI